MQAPCPDPTIFNNADGRCALADEENVAYILMTFLVLKKNEERKYGEYRTARLALAADDALAPLMAGVRSSVRRVEEA